MNIKWINKENTSNAITIYNNNITLSKQAAMLFEDAYGILVGVEEEIKQIVFKKVSIEEVNKKIVDKDDIYTLTMKPSFGRINNKKLVSELEKVFCFDFLNHPSYKFNAKWNNGLKMLIVDVKEGNE